MPGFFRQEHAWSALFKEFQFNLILHRRAAGTLASYWFVNNYPNCYLYQNVCLEEIYFFISCHPHNAQLVWILRGVYWVGDK